MIFIDMEKNTRNKILTESELKEYLTPITEEMFQNSIEINDFIKKLKHGAT